jgi:predicted O-methyltransferase YrrM
VRPELQNLPEPNWFHHGVQILDLLDRYRPMVCVELGTNAGCSAIAVARLIRSWGGTLTCVDTWAGPGGGATLDQFLTHVWRAGVADAIQIVCQPTVEAARRWVGLVDYVYVDADHTYEGCTADLEAWWPLLRPGGLIAGDDYGDPHGIPRADPRSMSSAWDDFERAQGVTFQRTLSPLLLGCQCEACHASPLIWGVK